MESSYFELRCAVVEMFYESLLEEGYTFGQAAARCLVEFRREVHGQGREKLVVLSVLLARVARHDSAALARFAPEVEFLHKHGQASAGWRGWSGVAKQRLQEDLRFVLEKAAALKPS